MLTANKVSINSLAEVVFTQAQQAMLMCFGNIKLSIILLAMMNQKKKGKAGGWADLALGYVTELLCNGESGGVTMQFALSDTDGE